MDGGIVSTVEWFGPIIELGGTNLLGPAFTRPLWAPFDHVEAIGIQDSSTELTKLKDYRAMFVVH